MNKTIIFICICLLLVVFSPSPQLSSIAYILLFLVSGVGLCSEATKINQVGQVRARLHRSNRAITIIREASPLRFQFYLISYWVLGLICFAAAAFAIFATCRHYFA